MMKQRTFFVESLNCVGCLPEKGTVSRRSSALLRLFQCESGRYPVPAKDAGMINEVCFFFSVTRPSRRQVHTSVYLSHSVCIRDRQGDHCGRSWGGGADLCDPRDFILLPFSSFLTRSEARIRCFTCSVPGGAQKEAA